MAGATAVVGFGVSASWAAAQRLAFVSTMALLLSGGLAWAAMVRAVARSHSPVQSRLFTLLAWRAAGAALDSARRGWRGHEAALRRCARLVLDLECAARGYRLTCARVSLL
jgi:hypothetical protein